MLKIIVTYGNIFSKSKTPHCINKINILYFIKTSVFLPRNDFSDVYVDICSLLEEIA
jgi:hypothetical protein